MRRIIYKAILFATLIPASLSLAGPQKLEVNINNMPIELTDSAPFIDSNGRTMVPVRVISENLGAFVDWNYASKLFIIEGINGKSKENVSITGEVGKPNVVVNNLSKRLDPSNSSVTVVVKDDRCYVQFAFLVQS